MSSEQTGNSSLVAVLSILAILAISLVAGLLLMQKGEDSKSEIGKTISSNAEKNPSDEFDPITWAREDAEYPPLIEDGDFVADYAGIENGDEASESSVVLKTREEELAPTESEKPAYHEEVVRSASREVREDMYWVQVVATKTIANAERVRDDLAEMGLPVRVFTKDESGNLIYRVRLGPFTHKTEAENSVSVIHGIDGFADSYVTIAPVTRYIEN